MLLACVSTLCVSLRGRRTLPAPARSNGERMNGRRKANIILVLVFFVGLSVALYPTISTAWNEYRARQLVTSYDQTVSRATAEDEDYFAQEIGKAQRYNATLANMPVPDAFSVREGVKDVSYEALLNVNGDGMIGYVEIPCLDEKLPIYHYTTESVLLKGAGHLLGSALPVGGEGTHCVVSAHRGLPHAKMFKELDLMEVGDEFYFHVLGKVFAYEVDQILVVEPSEVESLGVTEGKDYATLITCTPYAVNTRRLLVRGHRVEFDEAAYEKAVGETAAKSNVPYLLMQLLCVALGLVIAFVIVRLLDRRRQAKSAPAVAGRHSRMTGPDGGPRPHEKEGHEETGEVRGRHVRRGQDGGAQ